MFEKLEQSFALVSYQISIEEYASNDVSHMGGQNDNQNFLQYWGKEIAADEGLKEEIMDIDGPVGQVLDEFQDHELHHSVPSIEDFEVDESFYTPENNELDSIMGIVEKNFEEIINESDAVQRCMSARHPWTPESFGTKCQEIKEENNVNVSMSQTNSCRKLRRREAKLVRKSDSAQRPRMDRQCKQADNRREVRSSNENLDDKNTGLIIKIRSGNNVIMREKISVADRPKQIITKVKSKTEEQKETNAQECSSSTSTLSVEKQDVKSRKMSQASVSSIELENNIKIFCRGIGPLRAEERRQKVLHYLEKKRTRRWKKRINYT